VNAAYKLLTGALLAGPFQFDRSLQSVVADGAVRRLLMASVLGAAIGLEREVKRKSAGVRTNLLICMGSAFFTLLSGVLAGEMGTNRGQVASNIVQGIGFLGAGLILHNRSRVTGLASAASIWVVASIGMACGAGLYAAAAIGAALVIFALLVVGLLEQRINLKSYPVTYEVRGRDEQGMLKSILESMDAAGQRLADIETDTIGDLQRVSFDLAACNRDHARLQAHLKAKPEIEKLLTFRDAEDD
jgi:putative Mg2+ transporter-C (MgtC) family protein